MYVLGIDGGGTKTKGVITSIDGKTVAEATVGATNPNSIKQDDLKNELHKLIHSLKEQSDKEFPKIVSVFAGMSGVDRLTDRTEMEKIIRTLVPETVMVSANNDAIIALYSGTLGDPGIVQIAGTGSITFGLNEKGVLDRVGGWGYLLGERGSGYALGSDGLRAAFLAHDGLSEATAIHHLILEHFQVKSLPGILDSIYQSKNTKEVIASLSKLVVKAADHGDKTAKSIIKENGLYIGKSISCLIKKLFSEKVIQEQIPVVITGGLFKRIDLFEESIDKVCRENNIDARLVIPKMDPVGGAAIAALKEANISVDNNFPDIFSHHINYNYLEGKK
ncbi:hypothetical protein CIL05_04480 [Virgibacillus profundi]|uniref:ATPase BadF/BadG/BcrA/BcrD type domain-containing protein n=1 Tax=Virgibacillus profundi TaxID=2024555 RepID=A0A2A2IIQ2_9BACI|nr:BadF/BadG/BcrA/BcrD ATPase family protein [Virgibacillus profundi]PAV30975.1 hypothetical protein CIL05_04480 [Virgibacillus profundi]PXY55160.1 hypothetical protein CIT14_04565 [Virgibacillus profundi]